MTLLEIMLALLILGIVVSMVSMTLTGSLNVMGATRDHGAIYHRAQVALQRISEDIASAVLVEEAEFLGEDEDPTDSLEFTTTAHILFNSATDSPGIALVSFVAHEDPENEGELVLLRSDEPLSEAVLKKKNGEEPEWFVLADRLRSVNFTYLDDEGEKVDSWTTDPDAFGSSNGTRKLPVAVFCTLEFWIDQEAESSISFTTGVLLPVGLINAQNNASKP